MLKSNNKFFNIFKLWLLRAKTCRNKLDYLQTDGKGEFINTAFQSFCQKQEIKIGYVVLYMYKENGMVEQC